MPIRDLFQVRSPQWVALETEAASLDTLEEIRGLRRDLTRQEDRRRGAAADREVTQELTDRVQAGLGSVAESIATISTDLAGIENSIDYGFRSLIALMRDQTEEISFALENPEQTRAGEQKRLGLYAFARRSYGGRWRDDAVDYFTAATTIDRSDHEPYWYLGLLYAFDLFDDARARDAFARSADYAWPDNPEASAAALLAAAMVDDANGRSAKALEFATTATERAPGLPVAWFDAARYAARTGACAAAANRLEEAVSIDPRFFDKALQTPEMRDGCAVDIGRRLDELKSWEASELTRGIELVGTCVRGFQQALGDIGQGDAVAEIAREARRLATAPPIREFVDLRAERERVFSLRRDLLTAAKARFEAVANEADRVAKPDHKWYDEAAKNALILGVVFGLPTYLVALVPTFLLSWPSWAPWLCLLAAVAIVDRLSGYIGVTAARAADKAYEEAQRTKDRLRAAATAFDEAGQRCASFPEPAWLENSRPDRSRDAGRANVDD